MDIQSNELNNIFREAGSIVLNLFKLFIFYLIMYTLLHIFYIKECILFSFSKETFFSNKYIF